MSDLVRPDGDLFEGGYGGQGLYISPSRDLAVACFGAFGKAREDENPMLSAFRPLAKSGLFNPGSND